MASDGTNYLVAWEDLRSGTYFDNLRRAGHGGWIVGDPSGLALSTGPNSELAPHLASGGTGTYLLVYQSGYSTRARFITSCGDGIIDGGGDLR